MLEKLNRPQTAKALLLMAPLLLYEEWMLCLFLIPVGLWVTFREGIADVLHKLDARDLLLFLYLFHMLFGERNFAYVGFEPIFVTEVTLGALLFAWRLELIEIRAHLISYYLIVAIGLLWAFAYVGDYRISALRDSLMLVYAIWVPVLYLAFRKRRSYELFFLLLKLFIVLKAVAYVYEAGMIVTGNREVLMEGFRFNVGYVVPSAIVISLFLPLRILDWRYKLLSLVMIPAIFTLFHRSIFLGLALAVGFFFWDGLPRVRKRILGYGSIAIILLGSFLVFYNARVDVDLYRILERKFSGDEGNISYRFIAWERTLESYLDNPILGAGVGRPVMYVQGDQFYDTINMDYFDIRDLGGNAQPHNSYLHILTRFGLVIVPILFYALWLPLRRILFLRKRDYGSEERYYRFLHIAGFYLVMLVFAFFNVVLESPHHAFPFWLSVAMVLAWGRSSNSPPNRVRLVKGSPDDPNRPTGSLHIGDSTIRKAEDPFGHDRSGGESMNILQIHNHYREQGGEDMVVEQERALLGSIHEVIPWEKENEKELMNLWARIRLPFTTHDSKRSRREMDRQLATHKPDLVHAHNLFPLFTPGVLEVAKAQGVPTVMTLHNYRLIHPNGLLLHKGEIDERSVKGSAWRTVPDGVYRDSILQTAVVAHLIEHHRKRGTWNRVPDLFIVLTEFAKRKLAEGGIPEEKMVVKPNFTEDPYDRVLQSPSTPDRRHHPKADDASRKPVFLYVGRMSGEKGVADLIESWQRYQPSATLRLVGDGPLKASLEQRSKNNPDIEWMGTISHNQVLHEMAGARALLFPSRCYEGFPMTLVEAFACGCPVLATGIGSQGEIVEEGKTGLKVPVGDPEAIADRVTRLVQLPEFAQKLGEEARHKYESRYTPTRNLEQLEAIYEAAADRSRS